MICPNCHQEAGDGRYCPHCGKPLPRTRRRKALIAAAIGCAVIALALVLWFTVLKPGEEADSAAYFPSSSDQQEDTSATEETPLTEAQQLAAMPALTPNNEDQRDWICGTWRGDDYTAKVQKVGDGVYRWQKQDSQEDPIRVTANQNGYVLTDAMDITYTCSLADMDELVFSMAITSDKQTATSYSIPWQAKWVRLDQNGQALSRASLNSSAFALLGQTYADIRSAYDVQRTAWREGPLLIINDGSTNVAISFDSETDSLWGMESDEEGNPALPADEAVCYHVEAPLSFFVNLRKDSLSVDELTDLLSGTKQAVAHKDKYYISFDSGGYNTQLHYNSQSEELTKDTVIVLVRRDDQ